MIKKFLFLMLAVFTFTACSNANDNNSENDNVEAVKPVDNDSISNNVTKKEVLFSNQKEKEKKRDIQTSFNISIDSDKYEDKELNDYQKALIKCEPFKDGNKTIIGFVDGQCRTEEITNDKKVVCNFYKSDLKTAAKFYASDDSNILKTLAGKYNIDFKMDIPEFNVDKNKEDDDTSFNFKFALPKIKIERDKSPVEVLIEESCK